jgi:hypothetical protein
MKSIDVLIFAPNQFSNFNFSQTFVEKENTFQFLVVQLRFKVS